MPGPDKFRELLVQFRVAPDVIGRIEDGYEDLTSKTVKKKKAAFFKRALDIMTELVEALLVQHYKPIVSLMIMPFKLNSGYSL